jgi:aquaporin Z
MKAHAIGAELFGTFMLMSSVLGAAFFSFPNAGVLGVAFSIGLTVMALAFSLGPISGGHFNPAVTLGLVTARRFPAADAVPYIIAQCVGAIISCAVFYVIAHGKDGAVNLGNFASNGYGSQSAGGYGLLSVFLIETVLTMFFLVIITGVTSRAASPHLEPIAARAPPGFAPIAIGLTLTAIHIMAIPVSNASVNPARSLATALFGGAEVLKQVWVFWAAPILGAVIGGLIGTWFDTNPK